LHKPAAFLFCLLSSQTSFASWNAPSEKSLGCRGFFTRLLDKELEALAPPIDFESENHYQILVKTEDGNRVIEWSEFIEWLGNEHGDLFAHILHNTGIGTKRVFIHVNTILRATPIPDDSEKDTDVEIIPEEMQPLMEKLRSNSIYRIFYLFRIASHKKFEDFRKRFSIASPEVSSERLNVYAEKNSGAHAYARSIHEKLVNFDAYLESIGFTVPQSINVFLARFKGFEIGKNEFNRSPGIRNFWTMKRIHPSITIIPVSEPETIPIWERSDVLFHERIHSLFSVASLKRIPQEFGILEEAFADFIPAHYLDDPVVGKNILSSVSYIRNISQRDSWEASITDDVFDIVELESHDASVILSNLLWKMRDELGANFIDRHLSELIQRTILFYKNYKKLDTRHIVYKHHEITLGLQLLSAAVLSLNTTESEHELIKAHVQHFSEMYELDYNRITFLSRRLLPLN